MSGEPCGRPLPEHPGGKAGGRAAKCHDLKCGAGETERICVANVRGGKLGGRRVGERQGVAGCVGGLGFGRGFGNVRLAVFVTAQATGVFLMPPIMAVVYGGRVRSCLLGKNLVLIHQKTRSTFFL